MFTINNEKIDFIQNVNKQNEILSLTKNIKPNIFDSKYKFYFRDVLNPPVILATKVFDDKTTLKEVYTLNGVKIDSITDKLLDNNTVSRKIKNKSLQITNNVITNIEDKIDFPPIKKTSLFKTKPLDSVENGNIGVIDLETYTDFKTNKSKVYAAGLYTKLDKKPITFYIDKNTLNSYDLIYSLVDELFKYKYKDIKFYCHNLGGFDVVYMLKALLEYNVVKNKTVYEIDVICRKDVILKANIIKFREGKKKISIDILDSYTILTDKLKDLSIK